MKTKQVVTILATLLLAACTTETEMLQGDTQQPGDDKQQGEVLLTLQNKIAVAGMTKADPIATELENTVDSLDVYMFGSDKVEGPYTFQERFSYRSDDMPVAGSTVLKLEVGESSASAILKPGKGLFTKFYCIANRIQLRDKDGNAITRFVPLQQTEPGSIANVITPGIPSEADFLEYTSVLLTPDTLPIRTPLPMVGASTAPLDLTDMTATSRNSIHITLVRSVARFDVVNDVKKSHLMIDSISMGNGRPGILHFPVTPVGNLMTYPARKFVGANANSGILKGAFYSYPSPAADQGYLYLYGRLAMNTRDTVDVAYPVLFRQIADGNGAFLEVSANHRYVVQITEADPEKVSVSIQIKDWEFGEKLDDYTPDHSLDEIVFADPADPDVNTYDALTHTITMTPETGSSFSLTTAAYAGVSSVIAYDNGTSAWLDEQVDLLAIGTSTGKIRTGFTYQFVDTVTILNRATITLEDKTGNVDSVFYVLPVLPLPEATQKADDTSGTNTFTFAANTHTGSAILEKGVDSSVGFIVSGAGGWTLKGVPEWITVTQTSTDARHRNFKLTLNSQDASPQAVTFTIVNQSDPTRFAEIALELQEPAVP